VFVPIVLAYPFFGLCTLLVLSFVEAYLPAGNLSGTRAVGVIVALGWLATIAMRAPGESVARGLFSREPVLAIALVLLAVWATLSLAWAERPSAGAGIAPRLALNFVLFPIALTIVRSQRHVIWLFVLFVAGAFASVMLGTTEPSVDPEGAGRLTGAGLNPNQLGELLIVAIVLAATLATNHRWTLMARVAALAAAALAAVSLYLTLSRGALLGLGVALLLAPFAVGRGRRAGALLLVALTIAGTVTWFTAIAPASALERVTHPERAGGSGREDLWRVGWRMFEAHPIEGVGAGNFPVSSIHYLLRPGATQRDQYIIDTPKVVHNIYLNVLSELGLVGFTLFSIIIVSCLWSVLRAARTFARRGQPVMEKLTRGLFIALVGHLAALFFSSQLYSKQLWLLLALGPTLLAIAERGSPDEGSRVT
jgi:O-antigen ligase